MLTIGIQQDPQQLTRLRRIAEAVEALAPLVPIAKRLADASERAADALEQLTQPQVGENIRVVTYSFEGRMIQSTGGSIMFTGKVTDPGIPGTLDVTAVVKDAEGNPADFDSPPTWAADNAAVIDSVVVAADGLSAKLHLTNTIGASNITMTAIENGVSKDYVDVVSIVAGDATSVEFQFGTPVPD